MAREVGAEDVRVDADVAEVHGLAAALEEENLLASLRDTVGRNDTTGACSDNDVVVWHSLHICVARTNINMRVREYTGIHSARPNADTRVNEVCARSASAPEIEPKARGQRASRKGRCRGIVRALTDI